MPKKPLSEKTYRMRRCINHVMAAGYNKKSAGNICAVSVLKKKARKKKR